MSDRKGSNRKHYLKDKLNDAGYDVVNKSLHELEELDVEHKRKLIMKGRMGEVEKQDRHQEIKGRPEHHVNELPSETDIEDFYKVVRGGRTERETKMKDDRFLNLIDKIKGGYIPSPLEVNNYSAKQQREIMRLIPYQGKSGLIKGRVVGYEIDILGNPIKRKNKEEKSIWRM